MNKNFKARWIKALERRVDEGGYIKGKGQLVRTENGKDTFCCLGVAADLLIQDGSIPEGWDTERILGALWVGSPMAYHTMLPRDVREMIDLGDEHQKRLARINDDGSEGPRDDDRFAKVIAYIKENC